MRTKTETCRSFKGDNGEYGVLDRHGCVIYEAMFGKAVADRLAELESSPKPPKDWLAAERILTGEGLL